MNEKYKSHIRKLTTKDLIPIIENSKHVILTDTIRDYQITGNDLLTLTRDDVILRFRNNAKQKPFLDLLKHVQTTPEDLFQLKTFIRPKLICQSNPPSESDLSDTFARRRSKFENDNPSTSLANTKPNVVSRNEVRKEITSKPNFKPKPPTPSNIVQKEGLKGQVRSTSSVMASSFTKSGRSGGRVIPSQEQHSKPIVHKFETRKPSQETIKKIFSASIDMDHSFTKSGGSGGRVVPSQEKQSKSILDKFETRKPSQEAIKKISGRFEEAKIPAKSVIISKSLSRNVHPKILKPKQPLPEPEPEVPVLEKSEETPGYNITSNLQEYHNLPTNNSLCAPEEHEEFEEELPEYINITEQTNISTLAQGLKEAVAKFKREEYVRILENKGVKLEETCQVHEADSEVIHGNISEDDFFSDASQTPDFSDPLQEESPEEDQLQEEPLQDDPAEEELIQDNPAEEELFQDDPAEEKFLQEEPVQDDPPEEAYDVPVPVPLRPSQIKMSTNTGIKIIKRFGDDKKRITPKSLPERPVSNVPQRNAPISVGQGEYHPLPNLGIQQPPEIPPDPNIPEDNEYEEPITLDTPQFVIRRNKFFREVTRTEGDMILAHRPVGTFLIRPSRQHLATLMFVGKTMINNVPICHDDINNEYHLGTVPGTINMERFKNMMLLLNYYSSAPMLVEEKIMDPDLNSLD